MKAHTIQTPIGSVIAVADDSALYQMEFSNRFPDPQAPVGRTKITDQIEEELNRYFQGILREFTTPLALEGTPFQNKVWRGLQNIPYAETRSYRDLAIAIGHPAAFRAVGTANGANRFPIVIPCHRVINADGGLGGYSSGLERKKWLLHHEQVYFNR